MEKTIVNDTENDKIKTMKENLPIFEYRKEIFELLEKNEFCIITGDTGSGKSTQLPQYILDFYNEKGIKKNIIVTQPRRIAAISMAKRICYERNTILGDEIGFTIRFEDKTSNDTILRYVTDGVLVRECLTDSLLNNYDIVVLDEAHERSLFTDILFALVKKAVLNRKGKMKLIITSATLNTEQFSKYFNDCPVLKMSGRCFPVELKYGPCLANKRVEESVTAAIRMHLHEGPGDILVFLTGSEECELARKMCYIKLEKLYSKGKSVPSMMIFSLYGAQSSEDQAQVFMGVDRNTRKLIFSTNIAETSLTIDGVGFVIDCGYVKQKCYNPRTGMDALIVIPISKVQAIQRAGRAGRTQPGKCFRMYSEQFYKTQMIENTVPEILRVNLSNTILTLKSMNIIDVINFEYMENPDYESILQALKQLFLLKAIDEDGMVTDLGLQMSRFPLEPSYSKALISSLIMNCEKDMLTLVALLSTENVWSRVSKLNVAEYKNFEKKQYEFIDIEGDHSSLLKIYKRWSKNNFSDSFCKENYLNIRALKQGRNIREQISEILKGTNLRLCEKFYKTDPIYKIFKLNKSLMKENEIEMSRFSADEGYLSYSDIFRMAITTGFFLNSARKVANSNEDYLLINEGNIVSIDPVSVYSLKQKYPQFVIFTELSGSSIIRGMMKFVSIIEGEWIKEYIPIIKNIDMVRLSKINSGIKNEDLNVAEVKIDEEVSNKKKEKINDAKERYLQRKKVKLN